LGTASTTVKDCASNCSPSIRNRCARICRRWTLQHWNARQSRSAYGNCLHQPPLRPGVARKTLCVTRRRCGYGRAHRRQSISSLSIPYPRADNTNPAAAWPVRGVRAGCPDADQRLVTISIRVRLKHSELETLLQRVRSRHALRAFRRPSTTSTSVTRLRRFCRGAVADVRGLGQPD